MKLLKFIKWTIIISLIFIAACLAGPYFVFASWVDHEKSQQFLDYCVDGLVQKLISDFQGI